VDNVLDRIARTTVAAWGQYASRVGGRVVVDAGLTFVVGTHPTPIIINTVFRTDPSVAPMELFAHSQAFYEANGHRFALLTSDPADADLNAAAETNGWSMAAKLPAMVCRSPVPDRPLPAGASLRRTDPFGRHRRLSCRDPGGVRFGSRRDRRGRERLLVAGRTRCAGHGCRHRIDRWARRRGGDGERHRWYGLRRLGGHAARLPPARPGGTGVRAATNAAFELGADIVALEASPMGLPLYSKMGYETVGTDRIWLPPG